MEETGWSALLRGIYLPRSLVIGGGMLMHALNTFIVVTVMPSVVREIGGLAFYSWATTLYIVASLISGATCARLLPRLGPRAHYGLAIGLFSLGGLVAGAAPSMPVLLLGRLIQGAGAGTLSALSFTMVRLLFPEPLWPRAIALISGSWGIATMAGPAVGGIFAEYGAWRAAFWSMAVAAPCMYALVLFCLPRLFQRPPAPATRLAWFNLLLLAASVLAVSVGAAAAEPVWSGLALAVAAAGLGLFARRENTGSARLLPRGACDPATALGANVAVMALLISATTVEIFIPYFLQTLHGMRPLYAGYLSVLASAGWTVGSVLGAGKQGAAAVRAQRSGPLVMLAGVAVLLAATPHAGALARPAVGLGLLLVGFGIGMCWPHLGARVFALAPENERAIAAGSITVIIMVGNSFGSAAGGVLTGLAGIAEPGGVAGAMQAANVLCLGFLVGPALSALLIRRLLRAS